MNAQFYWTLINMCDNYKVELNSKEFQTTVINFEGEQSLFPGQMFPNYLRTA